MPKTNTPPSISDLRRSIRTGTSAGVGSGRPEAVLREHVQPVLESLLASRGARSLGRNESRLQVPSVAEAELLDAPLATSGRADAIYNRFVIEFEPPGSLRPSVQHSATKHAIGQVQQYMRGVSERDSIPLDRLAGCAFDGNWIIYVTWERGGWRLTPPKRVDDSALDALVDTLESLSTGRGLTVTNLYEDFGRESDAARKVVPALFAVLRSRKVSGRTIAMFDQWRIDLGNASGPFAASDLEEWQALCSDLGVPPGEDVGEQVLFSIQTYFALVAKLVALIILEGATGHDLVTELTPSKGIWEGYSRLESGDLTAITQAMNAVEPGVFSWYVTEQTSALGTSLSELARLAAEYSAEVVEVTPLVARDVLKDLYQRLLPRSIRHRLGEYYTPDWLAQRVVNQVTGSSEILPDTKRVLDPACGSGTFLVEVISRMVATAGEQAPKRTLQRIVENVVGFDLSPLAVQAAKVNYLLALSPLLKYADAPLFLPVFLADSVSPPRRGGLLDGNVFVFETSEGDWRVPAPLAEAQYLPILGEVFVRAIQSGDPVKKVRQTLSIRLPLTAADANTLDAACALFEKLRDLHQADRNGMWWHLLNNAFAPSLQPRFDYVVGNPPWVSWETLPEPYRRANDELLRAYGLHPDVPPDRRQASGTARLDLSMLFVARCMERFLDDAGRLGFVITSTVFQSEIAGRGFRRRRFSNGGTYRFVQIDDLSSLQVFEGATNMTAVLVTDKRRSSTRIPVTRWVGASTRTIPTNRELSEVVLLTRRRNLYAEPADSLDNASPLLVMPRAGLEASGPLRRASFYLDKVREGVNTRGANGVFFLEAISTSRGFVTVRNLPSEGRNRALPQLEGSVEAGAIKMLLRGSDVGRMNAVPTGSLLFFHDEVHVSNPMTETEAGNTFPQALQYARGFEAQLKARKTFRNFDPSGENWLGLYSVTDAALAEHKVVVREIAGGMIAAPVHSKDIIPDHKLYVIPCRSAREADLLASVLSCRVVDFMLRAFSVSTSITGSFLRYIGIKDLSAVGARGTEERTFAQALGLTLEQYRTLDRIAASELPELQELPTPDGEVVDD